MEYVVNQDWAERPIKREGKYLTVFDGEGKAYHIRTNKLGGLEISTIDGDLKVVCKTSNALIVSTDE